MQEYKFEIEDPGMDGVKITYAAISDSYENALSGAEGFVSAINASNDYNFSIVKGEGL